LAAEKRLEEQRLFFEKARTTPAPRSTLSTSPFASSSTSTTLASSTATSAPTTTSSSSLKQLQNLPKSSLTKFIEDIQLSRQKAKTTKPSSVKHLLASYDTKSGGGKETFLDKLLTTLQDKDDQQTADQRTAAPVEVPAKKDAAEADFAGQLKAFISILEQLDQGTDYTGDNEVVEQGQQLREQDRRRDPDLTRGFGRQLGSFLEEELNEAAAESNQLSSDLDELLQELEEEERKDREFLKKTHANIKSKLNKSKAFKHLKKDKSFIDSVFHRFALLGHPLREEDLGMKALQEATRLVTENVREAALQNKRIFSDLQKVLNNEI